MPIGCYHFSIACFVCQIALLVAGGSFEST